MRRLSRIPQYIRALGLTILILINPEKEIKKIEERASRDADEMTRELRDLYLNTDLNIPIHTRKEALKRIKELRDRAGLGLKVVKRPEEE